MPESRDDHEPGPLPRPFGCECTFDEEALSPLTVTYEERSGYRVVRYESPSLQLDDLERICEQAGLEFFRREIKRLLTATQTKKSMPCLLEVMPAQDESWHVLIGDEPLEIYLQKRKVRRPRAIDRYSYTYNGKIMGRITAEIELLYQRGVPIEPEAGTIATCEPQPDLVTLKASATKPPWRLKLPGWFRSTT